MKDAVYLVMNSSGLRKMYKTRPKLKSGEYAVYVSVEVPDEFFRQAIPRAHLEIPEGYMLEPPIDVALEEIPLPDEEEPDAEGLEE
jgi:hypothetical protein